MAQYKLPILLKQPTKKTPNGNGDGAQQLILEAKKFIKLGRRAEMTVSLTGMVEYYDMAIENFIDARSFVDAFSLAFDKGFGRYFEEPKQRPDLEHAIQIARDTKKPGDIYVTGILYYITNRKYDELAELLVQAYLRTVDGIVKKAA